MFDRDGQPVKGSDAAKVVAAIEQEQQKANLGDLVTGAEERAKGSQAGRQ